jgi:hypothetical protein
MRSSFEPRLDILPESQRDLWPELDAVAPEFVLYGGTALGHRVSEDFDFFSSSGFDPNWRSLDCPSSAISIRPPAPMSGFITSVTTSRGMSSAAVAP